MNILKKYQNANSFYGKIWVILALMVIIPFLLIFYMFYFQGTALTAFYFQRTSLTDSIVLFVALILSSFVCGLTLMRSSVEKLVKLAVDIDQIVRGEKTEPVDIDADRELNDIAENFNSIHQQNQQVNRVVKDQSVKLMVYAHDLSSSNMKLQSTYKQLQSAYIDTISRLVLAAEYKDTSTGDHILRMSRYCTVIAEKSGISSAAIQLVKYAAPMHDIGKIGIPDHILMKKGNLTGDEFDIIKTHTSIGATILANSEADIIKIAEKIAISHHERWDGSGYPNGLSGERIPLVGRIVCLADAFDALSSERPYKNPYPLDVVCDIISRDSGKLFDPGIVELFLDNVDEICAIKNEVDTDDTNTVTDFIWSERDQSDIDKLTIETAQQE
jgi:response regulator RpfG family c-di-GMP phosphodiesterase